MILNKSTLKKPSWWVSKLSEKLIGDFQNLIYRFVRVFLWSVSHGTKL